MLKSLLSAIFFGLISFFLGAQNVYEYAVNDTISISKDGVVLKNAWAGGLNNPQLNHMDVNFDCAKDIIIFDRSSNVVRVYLNDSIVDNPSYEYAPEYARFFPDELLHFMLLRDYNNDGKEDIFTYNSAGLRVFKNVSDTVLKFEKVTDYLHATVHGNPGSAVYAISLDYPCIDDIDSDGDLDIISFNVYGIAANLYENVSVDLDDLDFVGDNSCWGKFYENQLNDSIVLGASCKGGKSVNSGGNVSRHLGASLTTLDLYGNNLKDLLIGDVGYNNLSMLKNGGTQNDAYMISVDYHYPTGPDAVDMPTFPVAFNLDVDNNDRKDLIVSPNERDYGMDTGNVWMYKNFGSNSLPNFQLVNKSFLVEEQVDVGTMALPVLADISGDQIPDLIIGNIGYFESYNSNTFQVEYDSRIAYYRNTGTATNPSFEFVTDDLAGISGSDFVRVAPAIADLDGDGDNDMIFGESNGSLSFYRNIALPNQGADFVLVTDTFMGQLFGVQPTPYLFDVDGDNAVDLLVGQKNGNIRLYLNQGDSTNPIYTLSATDTLGGVYNYYPGYESNAVPFIGKIDGGTDNVLVVADGIGNLMYYDGLDDNLMGTYTRIDSMKVSNSMIGVTGANLNSNDSLELIVGERTGGLMYLNMDNVGYNYSPYPRDSCDLKLGISDGLNGNKTNSFDIYPNPTNGTFRVKILGQNYGVGNLIIMDMAGRTVFRQAIHLTKNANEIEVRANGMSSGVYVVQIQVNNQQLREKMIIQ